MIKKLQFYTLALLLLLCGCESSDDSVSSASITIPEEYVTLNLDSDELTKTITFTSTDSWSISVGDVSKGDVEWLSVSPSSGGSGSATVTLTLTENLETTSRSTSITISSGDKSAAISVTQASFKPVLSLSTATESVLSVADSMEVAVTANSQWEASGMPEWITVTPAMADGDAAVMVVWQENTLIESRSATITFATQFDSKELVITQQANVPTLILSKSSESVSCDKGSFELDVTTNLVWFTSGVPDWITLSSESGSDSETVTVSYSANSTTDPRSATIKFGSNSLEDDREITITQAAFVPTLSLNITTDTVTYLADSIVVAVTSNTAWETDGLPEWITLNPASGEGNTSVVVKFEKNPDTQYRSGKIRFFSDYKEVELTITQEELFVPVLTVTNSSYSVSSDLGSVELEVTSNTDWKIEDIPDWITVSPASDNGNKTVTLSYTANSDLSIRSATLTISCGEIEREVVVNQAAFVPVFSLSVTAKTVSNVASSFSLALTANVDWQLKEKPDWITLSSSSGSGDKDITVSYSENSGTELRSGTIIFSSSYGDVQIVVTQEPFIATLSLGVTAQNVSYEKGEFTVVVTSNVAWEVSDIPSWITVTPSSGSGNKSVTIAYDANDTNGSRTVTLKFSCDYNKEATLTIVQSAQQLSGFDDGGSAFD